MVKLELTKSQAELLLIILREIKEDNIEFQVIHPWIKRDCSTILKMLLDQGVDPNA